MTGANDELITVTETMAILRVRDRHDIYRMLNNGELTGIKREGRNGRRLVFRSSIDAYIERRRSESNPPTNPQ